MSLSLTPHCFILSLCMPVFLLLFSILMTFDMRYSKLENTCFVVMILTGKKLPTPSLHFEATPLLTCGKPLPFPVAMAESSYCTCPVLPVANSEAPPLSTLFIFICHLANMPVHSLPFSARSHALPHPDTPSLTSAIVCLPGTVGSRKEIHIGVEEVGEG